MNVPLFISSSTAPRFVLYPLDKRETDMTFFNASLTPVTREPSLNTLESWTSEADNNSYYVSNIQCPLHCFVQISMSPILQAV